MKKKKDTGSSGNSRGQLPPIFLPLGHCDACGYTHPKPKSKERYPDGKSPDPDDKGPFLTVQAVAGFYGKKVSSIYSEKSRNQLPPCLPGKKNPVWDPCVIAIFLYEGRITAATVPWKKT